MVGAKKVAFFEETNILRFFYDPYPHYQIL